MSILNKAIGWVLVLTLMSSCTVFRQKDSSHDSASESLVLQASRLDSLYSDIQQQRLRLRHESRQEWTEILPIGTFSYRPDSGFSGKAVTIRVYRDQSAQQWTKDSSTIRMGSRHQDTSSSEAFYSRIQERAAQTSKLEPVPQRWLLAAAALTVLLIVFVWFARQKRQT